MSKPIGSTTGLLLLLGVSACATPAVKPVLSGAADPSKVDGGYYADAVAALGRRDYVAALDLLQAARAQAPNDVRILNAFGVVYDKLGRFDLSARYYAQAQALDPGSQIVARNMAYSARLQGKEAAAQEAAAHALLSRRSTRALSPASAPDALASASLTTPLPLPPAPPPPHSRSRLRLFDATGEADGAGFAEARLIKLGWAAPASLQRLPRRSVSEITFPHARARAALALAHTLPVRARLVDCHSACGSLQLVVGADLTSWRSAAESGLAQFDSPVAAPRPASGPAALTELAPAVSSRALHADVRGPLRLFDATGETGGAGLTRTRLAQLGWSAAAPRQRLPRRWTSEIVFPHARAGVALALARTLPVRTRLVDCRSACGSLQLVVGANLTSWRPAAGKTLALGSDAPEAAPRVLTRAERLFGVSRRASGAGARLIRLGWSASLRQPARPNEIPNRSGGI